MMVEHVPKPERWDLLYRLHESAKNLSDHETEIKRLMQNACREMPTLGLGTTSTRSVTTGWRPTSREQNKSHIDHGGAPARTKPASERQQRALQKKAAPAGGVKGDEATGTKAKGAGMVLREKGQATSTTELSARQRTNLRSSDAAGALANASVDLSANGQGGRERRGEGAFGERERPDTSAVGQGGMQEVVGVRRRPLEGDWRSQQRAMLKWQRELEIKEKSIRMREESLLARRAAVQKKEMGLVELSDAELEGCLTRILHKEQRVNQRLEEVKEREESFHQQLTVLLEQERMEDDVQRMNLQLLSESVKHMSVRAEAASRAHQQTQRSLSPEVESPWGLRKSDRRTYASSKSPAPCDRRDKPSTQNRTEKVSTDGRHGHVNVSMQGDHDVPVQSSEIQEKGAETKYDRSEELYGLLNDSDKLEALTKMVGSGTEPELHNTLMFCIDVETLQCVTDGCNDLERACREVFDLYVRKGARRDARIGARDAAEIAARLECGDVDDAMFARAQVTCLETLLDLYKKSVTAVT